MTSTDLEVRTKQVVATINTPEFLAQIERSLPEGVPLKRFVQIAVTAVRANPDLAKADENSLFAAIVRCAQDGLFADGRQAALVIYSGKVQYLPMIQGVRKIAGEYGWAIRTEVVYENDEFEYTSEPPVIHHRPLRPGMDRGALEYAYAIALHSDGRRLQKVMHREEIDKRRKIAKTDAIWKAWTPQMWEKTVGHEIMDELPLSDHERFVRALAASKTDPAAALEQLYGPDAVSERVDLETGEITPAVAPPTDATTNGADATGGTQQAVAAAAPAAAVPGADADDEPEPGGNRAQNVDELAASKAAGVASLEISTGNYKGMTIAAVHDLGEEGAEWFAYVLKHPGKYDDTLVAAVQVFVDGTPDAQLQAA